MAGYYSDSWSYPSTSAGTTSAASTNLLPLLYGVQAISGAFSSWQQAQSQKAIARVNERLAEMNAADALKRGYKAEAESRKGTRKTIGSQRAALAAQGINVSSGTAADIQTETTVIGELDAMTIRNNALREAYGYKVEGLNASMQGRLTSQATMNQGVDTLLTGGLKGVDTLLTGGLKAVDAKWGKNGW